MKMKINFEVEVKAEDLQEKEIITAILREAGLKIQETPISVEVESENQNSLDEIQSTLREMAE